MLDLTSSLTEYIFIVPELSSAEPLADYSGSKYPWMGSTNNSEAGFIPEPTIKLKLSTLISTSKPPSPTF
jgi:hypothetical protein